MAAWYRLCFTVWPRANTPYAALVARSNGCDCEVVDAIVAMADCSDRTQKMSFKRWRLAMGAEDMTPLDDDAAAAAAAADATVTVA